MKYRVQHNRVDESDFDEIRAGRTANDLLAEVMERIPQYEDRVFTHGDYCLPNIIVTQDGHLSGFIDVGRAGTGDRYRDIALACRSIAYNWGREWIPVFAEAYGLTGIDQKKLAFYQLVDEFF
jgi:aminoglycoside phosphotransferase